MTKNLPPFHKVFTYMYVFTYQYLVVIFRVTADLPCFLSPLYTDNHLLYSLHILEVQSRPAELQPGDTAHFLPVSHLDLIAENKKEIGINMLS